LYGLGAPASETEAEDLLASAGVIPLNGWISDYPVTPEILGQVQEAVARAASEGGLSMPPEEATRLLYDLASQMGLPVPAGAGTEPAAAPKAPEQAVIQGYYTGYGPPIITYYPPPASYLYLYAWVPYPVWWYGYWYPGFYISHNFTTTIIVDSRRAVVRNRYVDPVSRRVVRIDPVVRSGDSVRSLTVLRTEDGRTYRNIREMRQGTPSGRVPDAGPGGTSRRPPVSGGFRSPEDRRSAQDIYTRSIERQGSAGQGSRSGGSAIRGDERRRGPQGGGPVTIQPRSDQRPYDRRPGSEVRSPAPQGQTGPPVTIQPRSDTRSFERRPGSDGRGPASQGQPGRSYDEPTGGDSRQFRGSAPGGARHSVTPAPPAGALTAPSGDRSYSPPSRGDRGMSIRPRPSGRSAGDDDASSGRGRRWGGR
jgi:hypothetical protein